MEGSRAFEFTAIEEWGARRCSAFREKCAKKGSWFGVLAFGVWAFVYSEFGLSGNARPYTEISGDTVAFNLVPEFWDSSKSPDGEFKVSGGLRVQNEGCRVSVVGFGVDLVQHHCPHRKRDAVPGAGVEVFLMREVPL